MLNRDVRWPRCFPRSSYCLLVGVVAVGLVLASGGAVAASSSVDSNSNSVVATVTGSGDNVTTNTTTPPHENPETVSETGDPDQVASYLSSQLNGLLGDSTLNLSEGQYDQARALLGDDYNETLQQYVEVSGSTDSETAESFNDARNNTRSLITLRQEFDQTLAAYESAVAAGDSERARELARELARLAEQIDSVSVQLRQEYTDIENATGQKVEEKETIRLIQETSIEEAQAATDAQLVETQIQAKFQTTQFSFTEPAQLSGRIQTANGTPLKNESVTIAIDAREYTISTTATGNFSVTYRPVAAPLTTSTFSVEYLPADNSVYLGANTTVMGSITAQAPTTVSVNASNLTIQYGTPFSITGRISVGEAESVGNLPVVATVAGQQVGTASTTANGSFALSNRLSSPRVSSGVQTLRITLPFENRSLAGSATSVPVTINPASTQLTVNATSTESTPSTISVHGILTLYTGEPLTGQPIEIFVEGNRVDTVQTTTTGRYETTLQPSEIDIPANATISAQFAGGGLALSSSRASTTLALSSSTSDLALSSSTSGQSSLMSMITNQPALLGGGAVLGLVGVGFLLVSLRRDSAWLSGSDSTTPVDEKTSTTRSSDSPTPVSQRPAQTMLTAAKDALESDNPTAAVQIAYSGLRSALTEDVDASGDETHWEFYQQCQSSNIGSLSEVYEITATYEIATFASQSVSSQDAEEVVSAVSAIASVED